MNNKLTAKQKKALLICLGLVVASYIVKWVMTAAQQAAFLQRQAFIAAQMRARAQADAAASARASKTQVSAIPAAPAKPPTFVLTNLSNLEGMWMGSRIMNQRGLCALRLELRPIPGKTDNYMGYSRLNCAGVPGVGPARFLPKPLRDNLNPVAIVLTGVPQDGALHFTLDKTLVVPGDGCETSSFTVTPFGTNKIAVEWREGQCRGVQLLMDKNGR